MSITHFNYVFFSMLMAFGFSVHEYRIGKNPFRITAATHQKNQRISITSLKRNEKKNGSLAEILFEYSNVPSMFVCFSSDHNLCMKRAKKKPNGPVSFATYERMFWPIYGIHLTGSNDHEHRFVWVNIRKKNCPIEWRRVNKSGVENNNSRSKKWYPTQK